MREKPTRTRADESQNSQIDLLDLNADLAPKTGISISSRAVEPKRPAVEAAPANTRRWTLGCLFFLQAIIFIAALIFLYPAGPEPSRQEHTAALDIAPPAGAATPTQPALAADPPEALPSPTPPLLQLNTQTEPAPTLPVGADSALRGLEITQGIQVFNEPEHPRCRPDAGHADYIFCNNSMPLVAGRHTLVRVYLACQTTCPPTETTIRLRAWQDGQERLNQTQTIPAETLRQVKDLSIHELRLDLKQSVNFEFLPPPAWMVGQVTFQVDLVSAEANGPDSLALTREFAARKPLRVAYLPIQYQGVAPPAQPDLDYWLLRMYPVPAVEYYRLPAPDLVWEGELNKGEILRKLLYTYWLYTRYNSAETWPDQLFGWLPQEAYNGGASDPFWCPHCAGPHSSRVAFGGLRPELDVGGPRILAHEIAHNLGAQHAWSPTQSEDMYCFRGEGIDIQVDPTWPYQQTPHIQEFGIDLYSRPPVIYSPSFYDMMAYCSLPWISPYTYRKIFDSPLLQPDSDTGQAAAALAEPAKTMSGGTLLVSGTIYPDGTVSETDIVQVEGAAFTPPVDPLRTAPAGSTPAPGNGRYCLELQDQLGASLGRRCFTSGFTDVETGRPTQPSPFFVTFPTTAAVEAVTVTLSRNGVPLAVTSSSNHPPRVAVIYPNGGETVAGEVTFIWAGEDPDGDALTYDLLYSPDNGQRWLPLATHLSRPHYTLQTQHLPPSREALLRVIARDGFYTGSDDSDTVFTVQP